MLERTPRLKWNWSPKIPKDAVVRCGGRAPSPTGRDLHSAQLRACVFQQLLRDFAQSFHSLKSACFWFKARDFCWCFGVIKIIGSQSALYTGRFLDDASPTKLRQLDQSSYPDLATPTFSWCLQCHTRGAQHNADDFRQNADSDDAEDSSDEGLRQDCCLSGLFLLNGLNDSSLYYFPLVDPPL